jgi:hypothetical protein
VATVCVSIDTVTKRLVPPRSGRETAVFLDVKQRCFGTNYLPQGRPETSVRSYQYSVPDSPEERSSHKKCS